jgi:hypothetical protein
VPTCRGRVPSPSHNPILGPQIHAVQVY